MCEVLRTPPYTQEHSGGARDYSTLTALTWFPWGTVLAFMDSKFPDVPIRSRQGLTQTLSRTFQFPRPQASSDY